MIDPTAMKISASSLKASGPRWLYVLERADGKDSEGSKLVDLNVKGARAPPLSLDGRRAFPARKGGLHQ
jgi:hypothetical protein